MLDPLLEAQIAQIHEAGRKTVVEFAGAGSLGLAWLHAVPRSSRTLLEATDRYSPASMAELIGEIPEKFVARETAMAMADRAYRRAMTLSNGAEQCLGIGCTATIATAHTKRGEHGCWIAVQDSRTCTTYGLVIAKGARDRLGEETLVSKLLIEGIAAACGISERVPLGLLDDESVDQDQVPAVDEIAQLLAGAVGFVQIVPDGEALADVPVRGALLSGSFNPLHAGHEQLAQAASVTLGVPVAFELPVVNADKPPLGYTEIEQRLAQFRDRYNVVLSRAPLYVQKAELYPGCVFVLGYDTAVRLVDPTYYGGESGLQTALETIRANGCRFLVAGRVKDGVFHTLRGITLPHGFEELFAELPEQVFRVDLSSTAIRAQLNR